MNEPEPGAFAEFLPSPLGAVGFNFGADGALLAIQLPRPGRRPGSRGRRPPGAPSRPQLQAWLRQTLAGRRADFPGRWRLPGTTPFQLRVYGAVFAIPPGCTRSYQEVAALSGVPGAARAVGNAMARNPLPLLVPCHRVVGANGLGGFGGGLALKERLLALEQG